MPKYSPVSCSGIFEIRDTIAMLGIWDGNYSGSYSTRDARGLWPTSCGTQGGRRRPRLRRRRDSSMEVEICIYTYIYIYMYIYISFWRSMFVQRSVLPGGPWVVRSINCSRAAFIITKSGLLVSLPISWVASQGPAPPAGALYFRLELLSRTFSATDLCEAGPSKRPAG